MGQDARATTGATEVKPVEGCSLTAARTPPIVDPPALTRRTLLGGVAAAGAASLIAPATGLAAPLAGRRSISSIWLGPLSGTSHPLRAPGRFALVGVEWAGPAGARIELRAHSVIGHWSRWVPASVLGHVGDGREAGAPLFGEPVWSGPAEGVQLRSDRPLHGVRLHFVASSAVSGARTAASPALAQPILDAGPGQPAIIARSAWAGNQARPHHVPTYGTVKLAFVHHTVNANGYSASAVPGMLRAIFDYHVYVRGYWDIAYNFVIDSFGRIWEARAGGIDMPLIGAQAGGYNAQSTGVAMLGDFMNVVPPPAAITALEHLLAWKLSLHGRPSYGRVTVVVEPAGAKYTPFAPGAHVSLPRVAGHRDGCSTDCPGNALYHDLSSIRPQVTSLAGTPDRLTIAAPARPVSAGWRGTVLGELRTLSGAPLAGAPIEVQVPGARGGAATTVATTRTAGDGSWRVSLSAQRNTLLRALHRAHPASVSDWALVGVAPVLRLHVKSSSPLVLTGTVSPAKRRVTVYLYRGSRPAGRPVKKKQVRVSRGRFTARLATPRPGNYVAIVRTAGDGSTVAGASPPVSVSIP